MASSCACGRKEYLHLHGYATVGGRGPAAGRVTKNWPCGGRCRMFGAANMHYEAEIMSETFVLGIDAGGTHTDAVLLACSAAAGDAAQASLVASAKVRTRHNDLPRSVREVLDALGRAAPHCDFGRISRVTLGATLAVNALVQNRADRVGLAVSAGPGLDARRFTLGRHVCVVPGGLDHRGVEVSPCAPGFCMKRRLPGRTKAWPQWPAWANFRPAMPRTSRPWPRPCAMPPRICQ